MTITPPQHDRPGTRETATAWAFSLVAALFLEAAAVWGALSILEFRSAQVSVADVTPQIEPSRTPTRMPDPTPTPTPDSRVPAECRSLYSRSMIKALRSAGLRIETTAPAAKAPASGSSDSTLDALFADTTLLECRWTGGEGNQSSGLLTVVASTTPGVRDAAVDRAKALGMTRVKENGGTRYLVEGRDASNRLYGESHFFREGLWIATRWYGHGQYGYTADIVQQLFS